jgi:hypothetical protein
MVADQAAKDPGWIKIIEQEKQETAERKKKERKEKEREKKKKL